ncbi:MAG: hypothetical protein Q8N39_00810 [Pelolinea sp.]|nr:hypothetical protein [Pelolinea sp.]
MNNHNYRLIFLFVLSLIVVSIITVLAAVNIVPPSLRTDYSTSLTANLIKPAECASITLNNLVSCTGGGTCSGGAGFDLILGSSGAETINGGDGNDCILGGGGDDDIAGGKGTDICIGGPGTDHFGECETQIQ